MANILIEELTFLFAVAVACLLLVWLSRVAFWLRNRLAKKFHFSKAEALFLMAVPVLYAAWRLYAWSVD